FLEDLRRRGFAIELRLIRRGVAPAPGDVARLLDLDPGAPLVTIRRLVLLDGEPFRLDDYHVAHARFAGLLDDDVERHYIATLLETRYGMRLTKQQKWLEPVVLDAEEARLLDVATGDPALRIDSLAFGVDARAGGAVATGDDPDAVAAS